MVDLNELEAIKRLKYRYQRCLDQKCWAELAECFTEDATSSYGGGKYAYQGRDAILEFLSTSMPSTMLTSHRVHEPEIDFTSETTARGTWAMEDTVIETKGEFTIRGAAFYHDEYVKVNGEWKIKSTGYERIYEEAWEMQASGRWPAISDQGSDHEPLTTAYASKAAFLSNVPRLIIEHNIHGIDIDPRAVQIAGLALWLRAQKSWQAQGLKPQERPQIRRSNVVCAEPMPGEQAFLDEFAAGLQPSILGQLVKIIFEKMKLAGEAGSLLKIEEDSQHRAGAARS